MADQEDQGAGPWMEDSHLAIGLHFGLQGVLERGNVANRRG